jgi:hypothetical protein
VQLVGGKFLCTRLLHGRCATSSIYLIRCISAPVGLYLSSTSHSAIFLWNYRSQLLRVHIVFWECDFAGMHFTDVGMIDSVRQPRKTTREVEMSWKSVNVAVGTSQWEALGRGCITQLIGCSDGTRHARTCSMFSTREPSEGLSEVIWRLAGGFRNMFLLRKEILPVVP